MHSLMISKLIMNFGIYANKGRLHRYSHVMGLCGGSDGKESICSVRDLGSIPDLGSFPGEGNSWASLVAQRVKRLPAVQETWVRFLGQEDPLEKEIATCSSTVAWKIPWMEKPGRLQSMGHKESAMTERLHFLFTFTHSSILVRRIPWIEEPGGLQSMGSQRVRHEGDSTSLETWTSCAISVTCPRAGANSTCHPHL